MTKIDYQEALDVQTACNLSGVLNSFISLVQRIPPSERQGHPICRLFAEQVMHLSGDGGKHVGRFIEEARPLVEQLRGKY